MRNTIDPVRFGLAAGILWAIAVFMLTLVSLANGYGSAFLTLLIQVHPGYDISVWGSGIGMLYGFLEGFVSMFFLAWLYNLLGPRKG